MTGQGPIRVLVVDDSLVVRSVLSQILRGNAGTELAGTAQSGEAALVKIPQLKPDVITLDIEMPGMNGLQTLTQIRKLYPKLPVIMFSTLTEHGASATLEALALGATDYAAKPTSSEGLPAAREQVQRDLIAKIMALQAPVAQSTHVPVPAFANRPPISRRIDIVAIGTSTGGPNALREVIPKLPADFPVPVVIVQHMPPLFTRLLAKHLSAHASVFVQEGQSGSELNPGYVWIAPGDYHMTVLREGNAIRLGLNQGAPEHSCRPAVDVLFRSVARTFGPHALAIVMTGMGSDGTLGAKAIHQAGGEVVIQDQGDVGSLGNARLGGVGGACRPHLRSRGNRAGDYSSCCSAPAGFKRHRETTTSAFGSPISASLTSARPGTPPRLRKKDALPPAGRILRSGNIDIEK